MCENSFYNQRTFSKLHVFFKFFFQSNFDIIAFLIDIAQEEST